MPLIMIDDRSGQVKITTTDANGTPVPLEAAGDVALAAQQLLDAAIAVQPAWEREAAEKDAAIASAAAEIAEKTDQLSAAQAWIKPRMDQMTAEDIQVTMMVFPPWRATDEYEKGDLRRHDGKLWHCIQSHKGQADWAPDLAVSLWMGDTPESVIADYKQPTGAHDAYKKGDRVIWSGVVYESLIDANVYSPGDYPQGWTVIPGD